MLFVVLVVVFILKKLSSYYTPFNGSILNGLAALVFCSRSFWLQLSTTVFLLLFLQV